MCVLMALRLHDGNDRDELFLCLLRIKFWVLILFRNLLDNRAILSYNTTPAEEGWRCSLLCLTTCLSSLIMRLTTCSVRSVSSPLSMYFFSASGANFEHFYRPKRWPHINHSVLGFDHIFDHKQIRSTRRQECTRVWKSRFCVAERAKKAKTAKKRYIIPLTRRFEKSCIWQDKYVPLYVDEASLFTHILNCIFGRRKSPTVYHCRALIPTLLKNGFYYADYLFWNFWQAFPFHRKGKRWFLSISL